MKDLGWINGCPFIEQQVNVSFFIYKFDLLVNINLAERRTILTMGSFWHEKFTRQ